MINVLYDALQLVNQPKSAARRRLKPKMLTPAARAEQNGISSLAEA